jgi:Calcineurin-like phosphoesterase.
MAVLNWLHLSDIHYSFENYDTLRVRDSTLEYLNDRKLDIIVVTGDIAYKNQR